MYDIKQYKKWIIITLLLMLVIPLFVAGANFIMDPLFCFQISNKFNQKTDDFNERQQKTNFITFRDFIYKGILIGSSTTTNIDQRAFTRTPLFNYAMNGLWPEELAPYVNYAKKRHGRDLEYVIIGLDFLLSTKLPPPPIDANKLIEEANRPLYRLKMLLSLDTLKFSHRTYLNYQSGRRHIYYDRENIKYCTPLAREVLDMHMRLGLQNLLEPDKPLSLYNYKYNENYRDILKKIKDANSKTKFIVFTIPVIVPFIKAVVQKGLLNDYLRWIRDIVTVFGECYNFMYPNKVTENYMDYFHDPTHCFPVVSPLIADAVFNKPITGITDFGIYINKDNIEERLAYLERIMKELAARP